ncbi:hypothetical protein [Halodesulfovibrio sp.]|jgi:hypothetical protein|uniref:hypothetical protein n=1 Tax=Halodesulfovibrio sp. TaxID=1912772 RepID=UPI0025DD0C86|nr:hypothetical protein [Halodesulfovibrio sp.]MCT4627904.1 hypothetical protein [Halodesulfovibrio sp.]
MKECSSSSWCIDKTINVPTILTILKSLAVVAVCAFAFYSRIVEVEAQASANAQEIKAISRKVSSVVRIEEAVKYQNKRIDDIYRILTTKKEK